jgi:hypothetical protein
MSAVLENFTEAVIPTKRLRKEDTSKLLHNNRLFYERQCHLAYVPAKYKHYLLHGDKIATEIQLMLLCNPRRLRMFPTSQNTQFLNAVPSSSTDNTVKETEV